MYKLYEQILLNVVKKIVCQYINQNHTLCKLQLGFCLTFSTSFYFEVLTLKYHWEGRKQGHGL